jgi:cytidylate kinase
MIITIDGPAGSGKSTASRELAARLGIAYLDTGAMYRAATLAAIRAGVDLDDPDAVAAVVRDNDIRLECTPQAARVLLNGVDVSDEIRSAQVSAKSTLLAKATGVRTAMVQRQRQIGRELGSLVSEGRDQGSVVFPDADAKFFLDATPEVRARRRWQEMQADGQDVRYEDVLGDIIARDGSDRSRAVAPLLVPEGAILLDTSQMTIEEVVGWLAARVNERR